MNEQQVREYLGGLADSIDVGPAPVAQVVEGRPGRSGRALAVVGATVLVAAAVAIGFLATRGGDAPPHPVQPATVTDSVPRVRPQSGVGAWWTPGSIHFATGILPFDDVGDPHDDVGWMVPAPDGVVVGLRDGTIELVETSGRVTELGEFHGEMNDFGPSFFVDRTDGRIAWSEGDRLTVFDAESRTIIARRENASSTFSARLVGFDDGKIYWDDRSGNRVWDVDTDETRRVGGASYIHGVREGRWLIEVDQQTRLGVKLADADDESAVRLADADRVYPWPGFSPDGNRVALMGATVHDQVAIYRSAMAGAATDLDLPPGYVSAVTWRDDDALVVVLREHAIILRTLAICRADTGTCRVQDVVQGPVVIAGDGVAEWDPS